MPVRVMFNVLDVIFFLICTEHVVMLHRAARLCDSTYIWAPEDSVFLEVKGKEKLRLIYKIRNTDASFETLTW